MAQFLEAGARVIENISEASSTSNVKGMKGATGFIKPEEWEAKKKSLKKSIENSTGYLLLERIDFLDTAETLVKKYGLKSNFVTRMPSKILHHLSKVFYFLSCVP